MIQKYKTNNQDVYFVICILLLILLVKGQICSCQTGIIPDHIKTQVCQEFQWNGLSLSHLLVWIGLGFTFPDKFILLQTIGILFELLELPIVLLDKYPEQQEYILKYTGGCLYYPPGKKNKHHWADNILGPHSEKHWWHVKITDIILNIIGFSIGYLLYNFYIKIFVK
jgi:hypothetical protein